MSNRLNVKRIGGEFWVYNSIFGNLTKLDGKQMDLLESLVECGEVIEDEQVKDLLEKRFLLREDEDEYSIIRSGYSDFLERVRSGAYLRKLQLVVSTKCNLACDYCYETRVGSEEMNKSDSKKENMIFETAKQAVDGFFGIVNEHRQPKVFIRFFGGEPLINWRLIKQVCEYVKTIDTDAEIVYFLNTNGTLVREEMAEYMSKNNFEVDVSLDAPNTINDKYRVFKGKCRRRGTFDKVDEALTILSKHGVSVEVSTQLNNDNMGLMREFVDYVKQMDFDFEINTLICDDKGLCTAPIEERVARLMETKEYAEKQGVKIAGKWIRLYRHTIDGTLNYCSRYGEQFSVNPSGIVYPCSGLDTELGTVDAMRSILGNVDYLNLSMRIIGKIPGCRDCEIEGMCAGGCLASAKYQNPEAKEFPIEYKECDFKRAIVNAQIGTPIEREDPAYKSLIKDWLVNRNDRAHKL